jgi:hypothetical protein
MSPGYNIYKLLPKDLMNYSYDIIVTASSGVNSITQTITGFSYNVVCGSGLTIVDTSEIEVNISGITPYSYLLPNQVSTNTACSLDYVLDPVPTGVTYNCPSACKTSDLDISDGVTPYTLTFKVAIGGISSGSSATKTV